MAGKYRRMELWVLGTLLLSGYIYVETGMYVAMLTLLANI